MDKCASCGKKLTVDEIGITKKLINRGTETFYCTACLANMFKVDEKMILEKIEHFRRQGCMLFPPVEKDR